MTDIEVLHSRIAKLEAIIATHDLCHDLHGKVDARAFADGCAQEQRKLYGCAPDADALTSLKEQQKPYLTQHPIRIRGNNIV